MRYTGTSSGGISALFAGCNRSKRSVVLDLKAPEGVDAMLRLLDTADVFLTNTRPGVTDRLGIGAEVVRARNPRLVYASLTGFGAVGPYKDRPAYDNVVQAYSGAPVVQQDLRTGQPKPIRTFLADKITSYTAVQGVIAALFARERDPEHRGQLLELNMLEATLSFLWCDGFGDDTWLGDTVTELPELQRAFDVFPTADGYLTLTAILEEQFAGLSRAMERPQWIEDPRYADAISRLRSVDVLLDEIDDLLLTRKTAEWIERFVAEGVPCAEVATLDAVLANPQIQALGAVERSTHPTAGPMQQPRPPLQLHDTPAAISRPVPQLGEHTAEILTELGPPTPSSRE
jgi:crotonobetainyl-CoA:carnitine CoA-transferase CaiB-like acyl-CoA transferase